MRSNGFRDAIKLVATLRVCGLKCTVREASLGGATPVSQEQDVRRKRAKRRTTSRRSAIRRGPLRR